MSLSLIPWMCTLLSACTILFPYMCTYDTVKTVLSTGDRENTVGFLGPPDCILDKHRGNCTGRKVGLYYKVDEMSGSCGVYGCLNETLATLKGNNLQTVEDSLYRSTYGFCTTGGGINPATGVCDSQATCPRDTTGCE